MLASIDEQNAFGDACDASVCALVLPGQ